MASSRRKSFTSDRGTLERAFSFDEDDLAANQSGRLSPGQRDLLDEVRRSGKRWGRIATVVNVLVIGGLVIGMFVATSDREPRIAALAVGGVGLTVFAIAMIRGHWARRDLHAGRVSVVEGVPRRSIKLPVGNPALEIYRLRIGGQKFLLRSRAQLEAFNDTSAFRVHHVRDAGTPIILSVERQLSSGPAG